MSRDEERPDEVFVTKTRLELRVVELGAALAARLDAAIGAGPSVEERALPLLISPLNGGAIFAADLSRALERAHALEPIDVISYARRRGAARIRHALGARLDLAGRDVIVADCIVDTGLTLKYVLGEIERRGPHSVTLCVLFDRPAARVVDLPLSLTGFSAPDELLVGYGLEHDGRFSRLPDVHLLRSATLRHLRAA